MQQHAVDPDAGPLQLSLLTPPTPLPPAPVSYSPPSDSYVAQDSRGVIVLRYVFVAAFFGVFALVCLVCCTRRGMQQQVGTVMLPS